jgi:CheY-like chemotaxis protein
MPMPSPTTVFLVDAFRDEAEMYVEYLATCGFNVRLFDDPTAAVETAINTVPDVVVTRIRHPNDAMDGITFIRRLREHGATRDIAAIVITTSIWEHDREEAMQAGCDAYVLLPHLPEDLVRDVRRVLRTRALARIKPKAAGVHPRNNLHRRWTNERR